MSLKLLTERNKLTIKNKTGSLTIKFFKILFIIGLSYLFLFPVFYMFSVSLQAPSSASDPTIVWIPKVLSLESISSVIKIMDYYSSASLTMIISIVSTLGSLLSCSLVAYGLARFKFPGSKLIMALVVLTIIVPPQTTLISSYLNFRFFDFMGITKIIGVDEINLLNTPWTMILPSFLASGLRAGLFIFIFRQFFTGLPKELEEAASIDGCGTIKTFFSIIVPLAKPAFITVLLFSFVWHWNDFYTSSMYFMEGTRPLTPTLNSLSAILNQTIIQGSSSVSHFQIRTYMAAGALLTVLPPLILYIFTQKYFTEGATRSGIVG